MGAGISSGMKVGLLGATAALGAVVGGAVKVGKAFEEAQSVSRKLNNVLGNMGKSGAAKAVEELASSLQKVTGVDDEVIKGGQTVLATFSQVAKSAGDVGGTFERATRASVDLAAAGFGNVQSASVMLGKALQDPTKGITALGKAGVTFTVAQKAQIEAMVATNDIAGAQAIILGEVERQVQGTAEAGVKGSERMNVAFGEVQESLGGLLADLFDRGKGKKSFIDLAADGMFKLSDSIGKFQKSKTWRDLKKDMRSFGGDVKTVAGAIGSIVGSMDKLSKESTGSGLLHWLSEVNDFLSPIQQLARALDGISSTWDDLTAGNLTPGGGLSSFASGGVTPGGPVLVGERGPEIVNLPRGSRVFSNAESQRMAGGGMKAAGSGDRPIYMDGSIVAVLRDVADRRAELIFNQQAFEAATA